MVLRRTMYASMQNPCCYPQLFLHSPFIPIENHEKHPVIPMFPPYFMDIPQFLPHGTWVPGHLSVRRSVVSFNASISGARSWRSWRRASLQLQEMRRLALPPGS